MTRPAGRSDLDPSPGGLGDAAVLVVAVALIVVPPWLRSGCEGPARTWREGTGPAKMDVNAASAYELSLLPGIGETRAMRLVEYRRAHGPFRSLEELERVPGMPPGWWERLRDLLSVGEEDP